MKFLILFLLLSSNNWANDPPQLFDGLLTNTTGSFKGENAYFHLAAFVVTPIVISTGMDTSVHKQNNNGGSDDFYRFGDNVGAVGPLLIGIPLFLDGKWNDDNESLGAAYAIAQTTLITAGYIGMLKGLTGRPPPDNTKDKSVQDQSEEFNFGLFRRGVIDGWPSGHVGTTTALVSTLIAYYPEKNWLNWVGGGTILYMLSTVSAAQKGQMHWFSDGVAGALVGFSIGTTVGENFRTRLGESPQVSNNSIFLPLLDSQRQGIQWVKWF